MDFNSQLESAVALFRNFDKSKPVRVVSHLDSDGISAASILINALNNENVKYSVSILTKLSSDKLKELAGEDYFQYFFTDLGSGHVSQMEEYFKDKKIIILDHHEPEDHILKTGNIAFVNPHLAGIDGSKTISGSGVVFLFTKMLNPIYENMAHIAIIGAIGDMQENNGFTGLNQEILELAQKHKKIEVQRGLKFFGQQSRPLYKVLEYSSEIPGVSNSESGAIQFLMQLEIEPKKDNDWRMISDLSHEEMQKLIAGIIIRRASAGEQCPEDVIGNIYILPNEEPGSILRDAREFSTLLNSCGRTNKALLGICVCLKNEEETIKALKNQNSYKKEIVKALKWYEKNSKSDKIICNGNYVIINAEDNVIYTIIGTVASILARGNCIPNNTYILSMARNRDDNQTKISMRYAGKPSQEIDLHALMTKIISNLGEGETGGHANAAGAVICSDNEQKFINEATKVLELV